MATSIRACCITALVAVFAAQLCLPVEVGAQAEDRKKEELKRQIVELQRQRDKLAKIQEKKIEESSIGGAGLAETISRYESLYMKCSGKKNQRCADVMFTLSKLYYDKARDDYISARNRYEKAMEKWERNPTGPEPVNPVPDYSKSLDMYQRSVSMYPEFEKADEAYYQIGTIYLVSGELEKSKAAFQDLLDKVPNSVRASAAHFRIADFCFMDHDYTCALKNIEKIKTELVTLEVQEMAHYRKAEIYYNRAEFDKAADLFFEYVEKCDAGLYLKKELRNEALEYLAISFSDMPNGAQVAIDFFKKKGGRSFEDYLIYTVGMKNFEHGQYDQALLALETALKAYPNYKDAPVAQQMVINCFVIRKKYNEANVSREALVDVYGPRSEWASRNASDKAALENAQNQVKKALAAIPIFYHADFQKSKKKQAAEKALERYNEYFTKFPDDKWKIYEFKYNVAEIYNTLGEYREAAKCYDFVAQQDLATYAKFVADEIDTFALDKEEIEKRKGEQSKKSPVNISQQDAGYNAVVALDNLRKKEIAKQGFGDEQAYALPETKELLNYIGTFESRFPGNENTPDLVYLAGNIHYSAKAFPAAIAEFKKIVQKYASSKIANKAQRMLANSYSASGEYHLALSEYRTLLSKEKAGTPGHIEVLDLAAGSLFKKANDMKKSGDLMGAAGEFKNVFQEFPESKVADRAWFEAGNTYEEGNNPELAAATFVDLGEKFPKSELREKAYVRAAEAYKKLGKKDEAAKVYELAAMKVAKPDYAIPSLSMAAKAYEESEMFGKAAKMSEMIFERFPTDSRASQGLYEAGLMYEKGKLFSDAIRVYDILSAKFPQSEYASEGAYSVGFCYEKMDKKSEMADAFAGYAQKFTDNKSKQVMALVRAAEAYSDLDQMTQAEKYAETATKVYEQFRKKEDIDLVAASKAYYMLGEINQKVFNAVTLRGKNEKEIEAKLKEKTRALETVLKAYAKVIELGVGEYVVRSTYMIGQAFVDMAEAYRNQSLFGDADQQVASKIKIVSGLEKYYLKAQEKFHWNIQTSYEQGIKNEWVDKSRNEFMRMAFLKGDLLEEVGRIFVSAKCPKGMSVEDCQMYREVLEEKQLEAQDAAIPKYEEGIAAAAELGLAESEWLEKIRERLRYIKPDSDALNVQVVARAPEPTSKASSSETSKGGDQSSARYTNEADERLSRNLRRIENVVEMRIPLEDKLAQLKSIEKDAEREIGREETMIAELKGKSGAN